MRYQNKGKPYLRPLHPSMNRRLHTQNFLSEYEIPIGVYYTPEQMGVVEPYPEEYTDKYGNIWKLQDGDAKAYPKVQGVKDYAPQESWGAQAKAHEPQWNGDHTHPSSMFALSSKGFIEPTDEDIPKGI